MGHNPTIGIPTFSGELEFAPDEPESSGLRMTIQSASLNVQDDISAKDRSEMERLMKGEVLEVGKYPEIRYEASGIKVKKLDSALYSAEVNGELSFHGVTQKLPLTARITMLGEMLRASGDFTMRQSDFHVKPVSVAGGALKLKDELKFSFEMLANSK